MKFSKEAINSEKLFGENVRKLRMKRELSAEKFVTYLNERGFEVSQRSIYRIERGEKHISLRECVAIANALDVTLDKLLVGINNSEEK